MKGYKGFDSNFRCRDKQYEVGQKYTFDGAIEICECGFHFCDTPLAVFEYYAPADSRYALVEATGKLVSEGHKYCTDELTILKELTLDELIAAQQSEVESTTGNYSAATSTGDYSAATNTGYQSAATNTGDYSTATNTGDYSAATNTGDYSTATNTGDYSAATNTGDYSAATNTGDYSAATNTGYQSAATNTGDCSAATNTGYQSAASVSGRDSVAIVTGMNSKAKGALGCWLVLTERRDGSIFDVQVFKVDGKRIKPDTFYTLKDGLPVEVED